jgi:hypothetical protein
VLTPPLPPPRFRRRRCKFVAPLGEREHLHFYHCCRLRLSSRLV